MSNVDKIKEMKETGTCNFLCWLCEVSEPCEEYNRKSGGKLLDQREARKVWAEDYLRGRG